MKKMILGVVAVVMALMGMTLSGVTARPVMAVDSQLCKDFEGNQELYEAAGCKDTDTLDKAANNVINIVLSFVGLLAVGVMIFGGINYMISTGDAGKVQKAKNIIMYGLIGLVVTLLAYAIVNFVIDGISV